MTENEITRNKLCNILQTNADLPILALVDCEVVEDDWYQTWFGDVTDVYIDRVWAGKELKYKINQIANYIDKYTDACQECPARRECEKDTEEQITCKEHIIKYLSGD